MQRGGVQTQSAPQLPSASNANASPPQRTRDGKLTSSISTAILQDGDGKGSDGTQFTITDLLEPRGAQQPTRLARKRAKPGAEVNEPSPHAPRSGLVPLSPIQSPGHDHQQNNKASRAPVSFGQQYVCSLDRPENTELFTYASALCHRITGRYMTKEQLQRDPEAQKHEVARIQRDPELLQAISVIKTLSKEFKEVAHATLGHRKELGRTLLQIEESYLKLFEKLLELSLRMYWRYEQDHDAERRADKKTITYWQELHNWKAGEATKLQKLLEGKEIVLRTQQIQLADLERQCAELRSEVSDQRALQTQICELQAVERHLRERERDQQADYEALKRKHDESVAYDRARLDEAHEQHKHMMEEMRRTLREKEQQLTRHTKAIRELQELTTPTVQSDASTQTLVDDDGLWDTQDGVPRFVSKEIRRKAAWRRFHAFANCPNCRGRPIQQPRIVSLARDAGSIEADEAYVEVWSLTRGERKSKKAAKRIEAIEAEWRLPSAIVLFLSNLPKTVVSFPFYSAEEVVQQIDRIYDDKYESDTADEADGVATEELPSFICEYFLKTHGLRQSAEIGLYRFLISIKNTYRSSSHVHLFARFCGLLPSNSGVRGSGDLVSSTPGVLMTSLVETPRRGELDRSFLRVFLTARHMLLRTPPPKVTKTGSLLPPPQPHVINVDPVRRWVSLDHAVTVTRWYVSFLPEEAAIALCREVEYSTAIYAGRAITEISGNRLAVRAEMRKSMLTNASDQLVETRNSLKHEEDQRRQPRIVADIHKVLLLLMHTLEQRRDVVAKSLIAMFEAGDVNHDCVLSLDEFKAIVRGRAASFSDRRLLRMFREALMGGVDQSFALSMDAFVKVCNDHGLVTLLPDDRWADPFQKAIEDAAAVASAAKSSKRVSVAQIATARKRSEIITTRAAIERAKLLDEIPEELPIREDPSTHLSPRAEEVEEEEDLWEW